jgi:phosphatidylglycerol:prolipoprotein diacylglycerol transferase
MHPEIFKLGPLAIRAYGLMLFISFLVGLFYVRSRARFKGVDPDFTVNLAFLVIVAGVLGARLFYVLYHWSEFAGSPLDIINPFGKETIGIVGLNLYGGLVCAVAVGLFYIHKKKQPLWETTDLFAPAIALGTFLTRIGCFLNGCCFGKACDLPWAIHFPPGSIPDSVLPGQAIHPTQLYMSLAGLIMFFILYMLDRRKHFAGMTFSVFLMAEALSRFVIEFVRYYEDAMLVRILGLELTYNHLLAVPLFMLGLILFMILRARKRRS